MTDRWCKHWAKHSIPALVPVLFLVAAAAAQEQPTRWWTWNGFKTEASLISVSDDGNTATLLKFNGKEVTIPIDRLSGADRVSIRVFVEQNKFAKPPEKPAASGAREENQNRDEGNTDTSGDEDTNMAAEEETEDLEADSFDFNGRQLKMSEEIDDLQLGVGIRLGEKITSYSRGKIAQKYKIEKGKDTVTLYPKDQTSPVQMIVIAFEKSRVTSFLLEMRNKSTDMSSLRRDLSSKYREGRMMGDDRCYFSKTKPPVVVVLGNDKNFQIRVAYAHAEMTGIDDEDDETGIRMALNRLTP